VQGLVAPASATRLDEVDIFSLQGHPEFAPAISLSLIDEELGAAVPEEIMGESKRTAALRDEGVELGVVMLKLLRSSVKNS
jgi:hypothetical protein